MDNQKDKEDLVKAEPIVPIKTGEVPAGEAQAEPADAAGSETAVETPGEDSPDQEAAESDQPAQPELSEVEEEMIFARRKIKNLEDETKKLNNELETLKQRLLRLSSEYENFRKRTAKEKEELGDQCTANLLKEILPVIDNLERALVTETDDLPGLKDGVRLTLDTFVSVLTKFGVEEISTDETFDPNLHEAVMHEMDADKGEKEISEVFLRGYKVGEKVIRHSVVKVVN